MAAETGLSSATVSYALRGIHVPEETQERVREAAERIGYQVDPIARALASGRTGTVGVLCSSLRDLWQQSISTALGRALLETGRYALIVDAAGDSAREAVLARRLVDDRVDAVITIPVDPRSAHWREVAEQVALISIGDALPRAKAAAEVTFDNVVGVTEALRTLSSTGHEDVLVLTPGLPSTPDRPAAEIAQRVADDLGLRARLAACPPDLDGAAAIARAALEADDRPTAIFCFADSMAYGVYAAARELDLTIPDELSVLGYDDHPMSRLLTPPLSTFQWDVPALVGAVVERAADAIDNGRRRRRKVLTPEPRPRGSVAAAPHPARLSR
ncbi:LacI family transcriptional regulator [Prauserella muralis]|uniref:LacI family transcriptional regulator n=1 Tax=Prauserella muralis TaxID=588067 RepID=A0A2V4ATV6_9PSEU|nr:LacI family transcriptional regulator [Prauserella muralis]